MQGFITYSDWKGGCCRGVKKRSFTSLTFFPNSMMHSFCSSSSVLEVPQCCEVLCKAITACTQIPETFMEKVVRAQSLGATLDQGTL